MAEMAWMVNDPHTLLELALHSRAHPDSGGFNSGYYANARVDAWIDSARVATDTARRAALYKKIQRAVIADAPWLFVASWRQNAITSARVAGFRLQPSFFLDLHDTVKE
jgi:peptide/nickel transport system substrate-binding protein